MTDNSISVEGAISLSETLQDNITLKSLNLTCEEDLKGVREMDEGRPTDRQQDWR